MAITQPGVKSNKFGQREVAGDEGEESDEYEVPDDEDEEGGEEGDSDDDSGDEEEQGGGLTAMLLGENIGETGNYDEDKGWVPAGGKEPADYSGEEDEDESENDRDEPAGLPPTENSPGKSWNGAASSGGKKRARENDPGDESREEKKTKLPTGPTH